MRVFLAAAFFHFHWTVLIDLRLDDDSFHPTGLSFYCECVESNSHQWMDDGNKKGRNKKHKKISKKGPLLIENGETCLTWVKVSHLGVWKIFCKTANFFNILLCRGQKNIFGSR